MIGDDIENTKKLTQATNELTEAEKYHNEQESRTKQLLDETSQFAQKAGIALESLVGSLKKSSVGQKDSSILMKNQADTLGLLAGAALGATKAFDGFGNMSSVMTFSDTLEKAVSMAQGLGKGAIGALRGIGDALGIPTKGLNTVKSLSTELLSIGKRMAEVTDTGLKLQTGFLQMSAASGNLGRVFDQSGPGLEHLNNLLQQQNKMMSAAQGATYASTAEVVKYYNALGKIPGYLNENITGIEKNEQSINMLTAAIKLANATGQTEEDIIRDLITAYTAYGAEGKKALEFTAQIADLSQKYNIQIEDTRSFMTDMANSFKYLGENTEGTANIFDRFFKGLKDTGLSARASKDIVDDFGKSIANLSIAQKAFLSQRTGGPGGLMGAVQIEQEIRSKQLDKVRQRIEAALKQQFGRIVTQEEGARSEGGAREFIRQRMFLQQGPFGQIFGGGAEGEGKATRFLEALAKEGGKTTEATQLLKTEMQRGTAVTEKTVNPLTKAVVELEGIRMLSGIIALNTAQKAFGPGTQNAELKRLLVGGITEAMEVGTQAVEGSKKLQQDDTTALEMTRATHRLAGLGTLFSEGAKSGMKEFQNLMSPEDQKAIDENKPLPPARHALDQHVARAVAAKPQPAIGAETATRHMQHQPPPPQNITVQVNSVCPDCHKKFVSAQQLQGGSISNAPAMGPTGNFGAGF